MVPKVFVLTLLSLSYVACVPYTTKYDGIDLDGVLRSPRLLNAYLKCMIMDHAPCTPEGAELKRLLPQALNDGCANCSPRQRSGAEKAIRYIMEHHPTEWKKLEDKYDKNHNYRAKFLKQQQGHH